jgi:D-amino peptidase
MRIGLIFGLISVLALAAVTASNGQQPRKLKVLISVDMEGIAGVVTAAQLGPGSFEYERFRRFMTLEALAAVEGAKQGGATEVVVTDAHGNEQNLLIDLFPADVRIVRGEPRHLGMMGGLDASFDAAMFVGYHASTSNPAGVRAHTFSSARFTRPLPGNLTCPSCLRRETMPPSLRFARRSAISNLLRPSAHWGFMPRRR